MQALFFSSFVAANQTNNNYTHHMQITNNIFGGIVLFENIQSTVGPVKLTGHNTVFLKLNYGLQNALKNPYRLTL